MAKFNPRLTAPSRSQRIYYEDSPYYQSGYGLPNCTSYAFSRAWEILGSKPKLSLRNAENWYNDHVCPYEKGQTPKLAAIGVWAKGEVGNASDGAGHVMVAEILHKDGSVTFSSSAWNGSLFYTQKLAKGYYLKGYRFLGFIYLPIEFEEDDEDGDIDNVVETKLVVDGLWGPATTRRAQEVFGTPKDGIVSNQYLAYRINNPGLLDSSFEWEQVPGREGSALIRAIQKKVGVRQDGFIGPQTIKAMQSWLGTPVDGRVDNPSAMVKAFQRWLNEH